MPYTPIPQSKPVASVSPVWKIVRGVSWLVALGGVAMVFMAAMNEAEPAGAARLLILAGIVGDIASRVGERRNRQQLQREGFDAGASRAGRGRNQRTRVGCFIGMGVGLFIAIAGGVAFDSIAVAMTGFSIFMLSGIVLSVAAIGAIFGRA
ncbi:MAG: hypothetical protein ACF8PN_09655 [Phycisphaerales bacterium]